MNSDCVRVDQKLKSHIVFLVPDANVVGGVERIIPLIARYLSHANIPVEVWSVIRSQNGLEIPGVRYLNIRSRPSKLPSLVRPIFDAVFYQRYVRSSLDQVLERDSKVGRRPSILVAEQMFLAKCLVKLRTEARRFAHVHSSYDEHDWYWRETVGVSRLIKRLMAPVSRLVRDRALSKLDGLIILCERAAAKWGHVHPSIRVLPNPTPDVQKVADSERRDLYSSKRIFTLGRLATVKDYAFLIRSFSHLSSEFPDWKLEIVGDGPERTKLEQLVRELGLVGRVLLSPATDQPIAEYAKGGIFALTSLHEVFPVVLLEAKAMGIPIVALDIETGPSEIVRDEIDGLLVKERSENKFALALKTLMVNPTLRKSMGENASVDSNRFSGASVAERWRNFIDEADAWTTTLKS